MTDSYLRELERHFRASGSVEDEAAWLRARVQAGELEQSKLELAAYCGHEGARVALATEGGATSEEPKNLHDWVQGLGRWGVDPCVRAHVVMHRIHWDHDDQDDDEVAWIPEALDALDAWVACPCEQHAKVASGFGGFPSKILANSVEARRASGFAAGAASVLASLIPGGHSVGLLREAILKELIPWALGYSDPVHERVEARERRGVE